MKSIGFKSIMLSVMLVVAVILSVHFPSVAAHTTSPDTVTPSSMKMTTEASPSNARSALNTAVAEPAISAPTAITEKSEPEQSNVDAVAADAQTSTESTVPTASNELTLNRSTATSSPANPSVARTSHTILHTNDIHGRMVEEPGRVIGMAKLKPLKVKENADLLVDAGDAFQGLPLSNQSKGEEMARAMNAVGYDAMTAGNHEFDFGYQQLKKLESMLDFPIVSANVYKDGQLAFKPSVIVAKNGVRYGIIGVTTPETRTKTSPNGIKGVTFEDPLTSVTREMNRLNGKVDVFVVLSHLGVDPTTKKEWRGDNLTQQLSQNSSVPHPIFVIDGHSHTVIEHGQTFNQDILAQTGTALANVGKITFEKVGNQIQHPTASLIHVKDLASLEPDKAVKAQIDKANEAFLAATSEVILPKNTIDFQGERDAVRTRETNLGNAIADAMEAYGQNGFSRPSDFAVTNSGGIRASITKGAVTLNDVITVLPFGNTIAQISVKGTDVWKAFEHSLSAPTMTQGGKTQLSANGGLLQVSKSIKVYFDMQREPGHRIEAIQVLNKKTGQFEAVDFARTYVVATNDFTASGGDGFNMLIGPREEGISLEQVLANYLKTADLSQYATLEPQRLINGKPAKENTTTGNKVIAFPKSKQTANISTASTQMKQATMAATRYPSTLQTAMKPNDITVSTATAMLASHEQHVMMQDIQQLPNTGAEEKAPMAGGLLMIGAGLIIMRRQKRRTSFK
ncbi:5'-nucleotidase C-terminal domain-containing protein [Staphylococcus lutrae]|uniref:Multifunctional 2',3'-cyclic-nucleotide 2'-phosphodiesterase/5'-nucleotidase/3'-nucleotidase n=1 Tax=Staphylococcus lutrae TaxID=155085 RepID=A0AAC9WIR4_9STAP|nr:5'-nucleotidase C-terminal domain-containing protein [Staphylococcus lutrae]ARJ50549.1 multifunctional 2',3'-cyclic-nucleotide 2'-phosphodiesterase/5'-nucleotidase/3'-nucleotidase [Staphylococcus lutrae]PNZ36335.1 multifunctional 2',3'-cyclic-nucleotide 2'-phosphodiesterase/5'-nucleotidase/3'-nucleotidase [Staphylococcus lutrae]